MLFYVVNVEFIEGPLINNQYFVVLECLVSVGDDAFSWLKAFKHLIELRILSADADVAAVGVVATLVEHEDPLSAGGLEECAARNDDCLFGLSEFEVDVIGLSCADILRSFATEYEIASELAFANLGIDLAHLEEILLVATCEGRHESLPHSVDIVFVDLCLHFVVG